MTAEIESVRALGAAIEGEVAKVVFGQGPLTRMVTIALLAGWVALVGAVIMAVLAIVGFVHGHKVSKDVLVGAPKQETITV